MSRPSQRETRRKEIVAAFARVLARHGYAGATISAVAEEAGLAPGLIHHYFRDKRELLLELVDTLFRQFRARRDGASSLDGYLDATLRLDQNADLVAARCWVGVLAEAMRDPSLLESLRRRLDAEVAYLEGSGPLDTPSASALLSLVLGSLVFGALAPRRTAGFAAPSARIFADALRTRRPR